MRGNEERGNTKKEEGEEQGDAGARMGGDEERGNTESQLTLRICPEQAKGLVEGLLRTLRRRGERKRSIFGKMEKTLKALCDNLAGFAISAVKPL